MPNNLRTALLCLAVAGLTVAATSNPRKSLTLGRLIELTAPSDAPPAVGYQVEISGIGAGNFPRKNPDGSKVVGAIEAIREYRYPVEFAPPEARPQEPYQVVPITPTAFETINTGWSVRLSFEPLGKLVSVRGTADYVTVEALSAGYGEVTGPIYSDRGALITPNVLNQPKVQTTTTHFQIFALPGTPYEVTLHRGGKSEKHVVTIKAR